MPHRHNTETVMRHSISPISVPLYSLGANDAYSEADIQWMIAARTSAACGNRSLAQAA
ncbi:hypothetical protein J2S38_001413 [Mycolicibacterium senegalense]|nr:hypothetical protein [Mycolicibacterium senegalense]